MSKVKVTRSHIGQLVYIGLVGGGLMMFIQKMNGFGTKELVA